MDGRFWEHKECWGNLCLDKEMLAVMADDVKLNHDVEILSSGTRYVRLRWN